MAPGEGQPASKAAALRLVQKQAPRGAGVAADRICDQEGLAGGHWRIEGLVRVAPKRVGGRSRRLKLN